MGPAAKPRKRTPAQSDAEKRYYAKMAYVTLKLTKAQHAAFVKSAKESNMTTAAFVKLCATRYMNYVNSEFFEGDLSEHS